MKKIHIYTDGACSGNPGNAGIGVYFSKGIHYEISKYIGIRTNNYAELYAIKSAMSFLLHHIRHLETEVEVKLFSDSKYSIGVLENYNWNIVKNIKLIQITRKRIQKVRQLGIVKRLFLIHVKGHAGIKGNVRADRLAVLGKNKKRKDFSRMIVKY